MPRLRSFFLILRNALLKCGHDHVVLSGLESCLLTGTDSPRPCPAIARVLGSGRLSYRFFEHEWHQDLTYFDCVRYLQSVANMMLSLRIGCSGVLAPCVAQLATVWESGVLVDSIDQLGVYVERVVDSYSARLTMMRLEDRSRLMRRFSYMKMLELGDMVHDSCWFGFGLSEKGELRSVDHVIFGIALSFHWSD